MLKVKNLDYFITVDKQLINACKRVNLKLKVVNPMEFIMKSIYMAVTVKDLEKIRQEGLKALREKLKDLKEEDLEIFLSEELN